MRHFAQVVERVEKQKDADAIAAVKKLNVRSILRNKAPMSIWHGDGRIGIDCGACFAGGRLGCLRLDDLKEFYT